MLGVEDAFIKCITISEDQKTNISSNNKLAN